MNPPLKLFAATLLLATLSLPAQQPPRIVVLLDPAHGGPDPGAHLSDNLLEKDLTLAFTTRLRALLAANGFTIISTRDSDPAVPFPTDQRAEIANRVRPAACLILHATASGNGIQLVTSTLAPPPDNFDSATSRNAIPWNTAQTASIPQSLLLANELGASLIQLRLPVLLTRASIRPLDNLNCPAVAIEIAPLTKDGSDSTSPADATYQQRIAQAILSGLTSWRTHNAPVPAPTPTPAGVPR